MTDTVNTHIICLLASVYLFLFQNRSPFLYPQHTAADCSTYLITRWENLFMVYEVEQLGFSKFCKCPLLLQLACVKKFSNGQLSNPFSNLKVCSTSPRRFFGLLMATKFFQVSNYMEPFPFSDQRDGLIYFGQYYTCICNLRIVLFVNRNQSL